MTNKTINKIYLLIILIIALIISFSNFAKYTKFGFELDEIFLINESQKINPLKYFELLNHDFGNPILFFILLKPFAMISTNEIWLRILPLSFYFLSIWIFYKLLAELKISSKLKFLTIIIFLGLAPYYYLRFYVRPYSLLLFLILLTIYQTFKLKKNHDLKSLIRFILIIFFGFHTHYVYWVFLFIWFLAGFLTRNFFNFYKYFFNNKKFYIIILGGLISLSPITLNLIYRELIKGSPYYWWQFEKTPLSFLQILELILKIEFTQNFNKAINNFILLLFLAISLFTLKKKIPKNQQLLLVFSNLFWCIYSFTPLKNYLVEIKYIAVFILFIPISFIIIANKLFKLDHYLKSKIFMFGAGSIIIMWSLSSPLEKYKIETRTDWKKVTKIILDSKIDYAIAADCYGAIGLKFYSDKDLQLYGYSDFLSKNSCEFPSIIDHAANLDNIVVVGERIVPLPIEDTHSLILFSEDYSPLNLYFYQKK